MYRNIPRRSPNTRLQMTLGPSLFRGGAVVAECHILRWNRRWSTRDFGLLNFEPSDFVERRTNSLDGHIHRDRSIDKPTGSCAFSYSNIECFSSGKALLTILHLIFRQVYLSIRIIELSRGLDPPCDVVADSEMIANRIV